MFLESREAVLVAVVVVVVTAVFYVWESIMRVDDGSLDPATWDLLNSKAKVDPECEAMVQALETAPVEDDEAACAAQMREIVANRHLKYEILIDRPEVLLRCSPGMEGATGALWTRFTVQVKQTDKNE